MTLKQALAELTLRTNEFAAHMGNEMESMGVEILALRSRVTELEAELGIDASGFMLKSEYASGVAGVVKASERLTSPTHETDGFDIEGRIIVNEL